MEDARLPGPSGPHGYAFGPFVVDPVKWRLWRDGCLVPITGKTFDLLLVLIEHRDRVIRKDELMTRVWPDTAVDDNNLPRQMSFLRRALGQRPEQPEYVVTIPGHGYRFVASVLELADVPPELRSGLGVHSQVPSAPAMELQDPRAGDESMSDQPIQGVHGSDAAPDSPGTPKGRWTIPWTLAVTSCGLLAVAAAMELLRAPDPTPQPRRALQRITYDEAALPRDAAWAPDGTLILFKRTVVIPNLPTFYVVGLDGTPPRPVRPDVLGRFSALHAAWHPDGRRISIWGMTRNGEVSFLTVPLDAGGATSTQMSARVLQDLASVSAGRFVWAPSRRYIYVEGRAGDTQNVWRVTLDPLTKYWVDGPERLTTGAGQETKVAISPDGTRLSFTATSSRTRLWAFPLDAASGHITGQPFPVTHGSTGEVDFDARADGSEIAYRTVRAGRNELWERSTIDGQARLVLSSTRWRFTKPRWSPDGDRPTEVDNMSDAIAFGGIVYLAAAALSVAEMLLLARQRRFDTRS